MRTAALLERRPDIRQAEQQLIATNARIGAAKALFFPQVTLTGSAGVGATGTDWKFVGPLGMFGVGPAVTLPIFNTGRIGAGVASAEARQAAALLRCATSRPSSRLSVRSSMHWWSIASARRSAFSKKR